MANKSKPYVEVSTDSTNELSSVPQLGSRVSELENLTKTVVLLAVISVAGVIVSAVTLFIDQAHFNNATYNQGLSVQQQQTETQYQIEAMQRQINKLSPSQTNPVGN